MRSAFRSFSVFLSISILFPLATCASQIHHRQSKEDSDRHINFQLPLADELKSPEQDGLKTSGSDWRNESAAIPHPTCALEVRANILEVPESQDAKACWSLPMEGPMGGLPSGARKKERKRFDASINLSDGRDAIVSKVDELLDAALAKDPESARLEKAVKHFNSRSQRVIAETKDGLDYVISYRGFGPSSEAGDIILGEKLKLKSSASAEFAKQKHIDELHYKVVSNIMQVAMGLGMTDRAKGGAAIDSGLASLKQLVGDDEAEQAYASLQNWADNLEIPQAIYQQGAWQVSDKETKLRTIVQSALDLDPLLQEVTRRLHKYNQRSKFARASAHVVETTLGAAALTPTFVGPAAKAALVTFVMSTGGPEQCKILKELYLDKRLESRAKVLTEQAHLALDNYQVAILTQNPVLLACSESLLSEISGEATISSVFGCSVLPKSQVATGPITQQ